MKSLFVLLFLALFSNTSNGDRWGDLEAMQKAREEVRQSIMERQKSWLFFAPNSNDRADNFVDTMKVRSLAEMESLGLRKAQLATIPWSDTYWPVYAGVIANRYADPHYSAALDWQDNQRYLLKNLGRGPVSELSPAEKYDLLMGDGGFTLTRLMINEGKRYYDSDKKVDTWMGICHGWAPASFMMDRPKRAVQALAADGRTKILFYPSDIKALSSLLWANGRYQTKFIGGRCDKKDPERDANGRLIDMECLDNNPGTWHLAVVNQLGISKRSFVLDVTYDFEVWNQPAFGYFYSYVNPKTKKYAETLAEAAVNISDFPEDKAQAFRSVDATKIVGVAMSIDYTMERSPEPTMTDQPSFDAHGNSIFEYDLELNAMGEIVGGEWISRAHPDFLWVPYPGAKAISYGDYALNQQGDQSTWRLNDVVPSNWRTVAISVSSPRSQPLARVVEQLVRAANE